jgi:hypothetical protein
MYLSDGKKSGGTSAASPGFTCAPFGGHVHGGHHCNIFMIYLCPSGGQSHWGQCFNYSIHAFLSTRIAEGTAVTSPGSSWAPSGCKNHQRRFCSVSVVSCTCARVPLGMNQHPPRPGTFCPPSEPASRISMKAVFQLSIARVWTHAYIPTDRLTSWDVLHYPCTVPVYKLLFISQ